MRFGITLLTDLPWAEARPRWQAAESMGFDHAWTFDHLVWGGLPDSPWRGALPTLAAAAAITERIGVGTLVSSPNLHHPYRLFRDAQAVADVAGDRLRLGVGAGGNRDSRVLGGPDLSLGDRVARFTEFVELLDRLRREDGVVAAGRWYSVEGARTLPGLGNASLVVAANGPRMIRFAAGIGDAWVTTGRGGDDVDAWIRGLAAAAHDYDDAVAASGRTRPGERYVTLDAARVDGHGVDRSALQSPDYFADLVRRVAELGFTDAIVSWPRAQEPYAGSEAVLETVAADVIPGLR